MSVLDISPLPGSIAPERHYRDARGGMAFLERAFGLRPALVIPADDGESIAHAELWTGRGCVMIASIAADDPWEYRVPLEIGGVNTGSAYVATVDIDALYARAVDAGAAIVARLADTDYGSRDFSATDPEGFLWHFGTYDPRTESGAAPGAEPALYCGGRYADARAAIAWLSRAFGAEAGLVVPGPGDEIAHAQLRIGESIVMLGSDRRDDFNLRTPRELGGAYTQSLNVFVADPDAHHARAVAGGAEILRPLADTPYGSRGYVARDCEGYVWGFGTYAPVLDPVLATGP